MELKALLWQTDSGDEVATMTINPAVAEAAFAEDGLYDYMEPLVDCLIHTARRMDLTFFAFGLVKDNLLVDQFDFGNPGQLLGQEQHVLDWLYDAMLSALGID